MLLQLWSSRGYDSEDVDVEDDSIPMIDMTLMPLILEKMAIVSTMEIAVMMMMMMLLMMMLMMMPTI